MFSCGFIFFRNCCRAFADAMFYSVEGNIQTFSKIQSVVIPTEKIVHLNLVTSWTQERDYKNEYKEYFSHIQLTKSMGYATIGRKLQIKAIFQRYPVS